MTDALLRATGGTTALLWLAPAPGDQTDAAQIGLAPPALQQLSVGPVMFRRTRAFVQEGKPARYELLVSATALEAQVSLLQLSSADALLALVLGVEIAGLQLLLEEWSCSTQLGAAILYRLLLRVSEPQALLSQS